MADLYGRWVPDEWIARTYAEYLQHPRFLTVRLDVVAAAGDELPPRPIRGG